MLKKAAKQAALAMLAATAVSSGAGCASSVGDIDRTQPYLLDKSMFEGEWFVRQTVTDVPATSGYSFVGMTGELELIRWEIQEDYLVAYRAYEYIPGINSNADHDGSGVGEQPVRDGHGQGRNPDEFKDNPIAAFKITEHVDVQREYNPRTGEQTNVIVENSSDRAWFERTYMRVDWSTNHIQNYTFLTAGMNTDAAEMTWVRDDEPSSDSFRTENGEDGKPNYFDFTSRLFVQPGLEECYPTYFGRQVGDCTAGEMEVRTAFLKVDNARELDFQPRTYDDIRQGEFGYFRTERPTYDRLRGVTYSGRVLLANVHDIWKDQFNADGSPKEYADRGLRPVVYALSPNYPQEMVDVTREIAADWDAALKESASAARGQSIEELEADLMQQTGDSCYFCLDLNTDGHARLGDIRHNFIAWVDHPQPSGPLGYGPSSAHPETGRIINGTAYVYGAAVDTYAQQAKDIIDVLNGDITPEDLEGAEFIRDEIANRRPNVDPRARLEAANIPLEGAERRIMGEERMRNAEFALAEGLPQSRPGYDTRQLQRVEGTALESMLLEDELLRGFGALDANEGAHFEPGQSVGADILDEVAPAAWGTVDAIRRDRERRAHDHRNCVWQSDFRDPSILGLARELKDSGLQGQELWQELRERIYRAVMLHEVGHTMGLRHNFGGTADPLNYFDQFWPLKSLTINDAPRTLADLMAMSCASADDMASPGCAEQANGRMREYQYSTIMDYHGKFNSDFSGLGRYDHAAIASAYTDLVQVFDQEVTDGLDGDFRDLVKAYAGSTNPLFGSLTETVHYTSLPASFGGYENMSRRHYVPRGEYEGLKDDPAQPLRVPYIACFDEYLDATPTCHTWDEGADPYEIVMNWVNSYNEYYLFNNFQRDRVGFDSIDVFQRVTSRYFLPVANMYQHWLFNQYNSRDQILEVYDTMSTSAGFTMLWNVMATPRYGSYTRNGDVYEWDSYTMGRGDLDIQPGVGRRMFSRYDYDSGYFLFDRVLEAGYFYDQLGAMIALTTNDASVIGVGQDVAADFLSYSIPYYIVFQSDIDNLFSSVFLEDFRAYAPHIVDGQVATRNPFSTLFGEDGGVPADAPSVELGITWSTRIRVLLYGMALLSSNYDLSFVQHAQIGLAGSGEEIVPAEGFEAVTLQDPGSPRVYVAYRNDNGERWLAAERISQINQRIEQWRAMPNGSAEEQQAKSRALSSIRGDIQDLEIIRGMYQLYGLAF